MKLKVKAKDENQSLIADGSTRDHTARIFEGNWYFAPEAVDMSYLVVTDRTYKCPYKGLANWLDYVSSDLDIKNVGWVYQEPLPTYEFTKGQIGFYGRNAKGTFVEQINE